MCKLCVKWSKKHYIFQCIPILKVLIINLLSKQNGEKI
jgi:hypothetical protein